MPQKKDKQSTMRLLYNKKSKEKEKLKDNNRIKEKWILKEAEDKYNLKMFAKDKLLSERFKDKDNSEELSLTCHKLRLKALNKAEYKNLNMSLKEQELKWEKEDNAWKWKIKWETFKLQVKAEYQLFHIDSFINLITFILNNFTRRSKYFRIF